MGLVNADLFGCFWPICEQYCLSIFVSSFNWSVYLLHFLSKLLGFHSKFREKKWNIKNTKIDPKTFKKFRAWVILIGWGLYFATSVSLKKWGNSAKGASRTVPRISIPSLTSAEPVTTRKNKCHGPALALGKTIDGIAMTSDGLRWHLSTGGRSGRKEEMKDGRKLNKLGSHDTKKQKKSSDNVWINIQYGEKWVK